METIELNLASNLRGLLKFTNDKGDPSRPRGVRQRPGSGGGPPDCTDACAMA
jgi:hypothetical protein